jgi:hypothetical protein
MLNNLSPETLNRRAYRQHQHTPEIDAKLLAETALRSEGLDPATHSEHYAELRNTATRLLRHWFEDGGKPPKASETTVNLHIPSVEEILGMDDAAQSALVESAKGWPERAQQALVANLRTAAKRAFDHAEALKRYGQAKFQRQF